VYGGVRQRQQVAALRAGVDILVATPGRLLDLMGQGFVNLRNITHFVLDEADRMLDMGFIDDVRLIVRQLPRERQTLFFSATMPPEIQYLADNILRDPVQVHVTPNVSAAETVDHSVYFVERLQKPHMLLEFLKKVGEAGTSRVLVFTRTKQSADRVAISLQRSNVRADSIHGDKNQRIRDRLLAQFKAEEPPILVATDVAARGLDIENVTHVVNYEMPQEPEVYVHRIGRTGRAGQEGRAVSFCDIEERVLLRDVEKMIKRKVRVEEVPASVPTLGQLLRGEPMQPAAPPEGTATTPPLASIMHKYSGFGRMGVGVASKRAKRRRR
jgi:ATP-dependent RNA helicase RhlE